MINVCSLFLMIFFNHTVKGKASSEGNCRFWSPGCNEYFRKISGTIKFSENSQPHLITTSDVFSSVQVLASSRGMLASDLLQLTVVTGNIPMNVAALDK